MKGPSARACQKARGQRKNDCIMAGNTPCMVNTDPVICPGTVNPDEPDWGPIAWIGGSGESICYCPYTLKDKCYGKYNDVPCPDVECNGNTYKSGGACDPKTGECGFSSTKTCDYGCDAKGMDCEQAPEIETPSPVQICRQKCQADYDYWVGSDGVDTKTYNSKSYYCGVTETNCWSRVNIPAGQTDPCQSICYDPKCDPWSTCDDKFQACCYESAKITSQDTLDKCLAQCAGETTPQLLRLPLKNAQNLRE